MTTIKMWDRSVPPAVFPPGYQAAAGYIGGDTPHVWTPWEWKRIALAKLRALPIWVRSNPAGQFEGQQDARDCVIALGRLGVPQGCPVSLDRETSIDEAYVEAFNRSVGASGYRVLEYGSPEALFTGAGSPYGYWPANPAGFLHWQAVGLEWLGYPPWPAGVHAVQCEWADVDTSVVAPHAFGLLWEPAVAASVLVSGALDPVAAADELGELGQEIGA